MGSFTPWGAACLVAGSCWGTFTSVLIIAFSYPVRYLTVCLGLLNNRHQFGGFDSRASNRFWFFPHMRNLDPLQHRFDALIYFAQRFADVAPVALAALSANSDTRSNKQRTVDSLNHFESGNSVGRARQPVASIGTVLRMQQASFRQSLQNLRQGLGRDAERIRNILRAGAASSLIRVVGQVLHGHQRVVRLLGQLEHARFKAPLRPGLPNSDTPSRI